MKLIRNLFLAILLISFSSTFSAEASNHIKTQVNQPMNLTYSWAAAFDAVSYTVEIEEQSTAVKYTQSTQDNSVTFNNIPSGVYDIVVTAKRSDGTTYIVIADISEL